MTFPADLVDLAGVFARIEAEAFHRVSGKFFLDAKTLRENPELLEKYKEELGSLLKEHAAKELADPSTIAK